MIKSPPMPQSQMFRINKFSGMNESVYMSQIGDNESPDMLNMQIDIAGSLEKRTGYKKAIPSSLGAGKINGMFLFRKNDGTVKRLVHHGTKLYTWAEGESPVQIYASMANSKSKAFTMNDKLYILDGTNYVKYDGTTAADATADAYVPTIFVGSPHAGGGTRFEYENLITPYFKQSFTSDGTTKTFQLALTNLDAAAITASIDGGVTFNQVETTHFTVNRTTGLVTFITAPGAGTNKVIIKAAKTVTGSADKIKKCRDFAIFGGNNDTRVFLYGDPNNVHTIYRSQLYQPDYFPSNAWQAVGSSNEKVQKCTLQYDSLVIHKEFSKWNMTYATDSDGNAVFACKPVNDSAGCIAPDSVQVLENAPVSLDKKGVNMLTGGSVRDERNVQYISDKINSSLLAETDLESAISIDYNSKYFIILNNNAYVYDYRQQAWYKWDNIKASCLIEIDKRLYFGDNTTGMIYKFYIPTETEPYNDDGVAINAYWKSKLMALSSDEMQKLVERVFFNLRPDVRSSADVYYISDKVVSDLVTTERADMFDFETFDFSDVSFVASNLPQERMTKVKVKKTVYFQLLFKNDNLNEAMAITSIGIKYINQRYVR